MPSCRTSWFVAVGLFTACAGTARPNVGYFSGSGQDIVLASTADVQMVSEDVSIVVRLDAAEYRCVFELRNLSDEPVQLQAGFPLNGDDFQGARHAGRSIEDNRQSCDWPEVDIVANEFRFLARDSDATYHARYVRHDAQQKFQHLFLWTMTFAPHETRMLHVSYEIPASETLWSSLRGDWEMLTGQAQWQAGENSFGSMDDTIQGRIWLWGAYLRWYSYVTATGASWAGEIERADFHVRAAFTAEDLFNHFRKQVKAAAEFPIEGMPPPQDPVPVLTWLCLAPAGSKPALDERGRAYAESQGIDWKPRPIPDSYDWHFAPFTPGPEIAIGWLTTFLPATAAGVRAIWQQSDSGSLKKEPGLLRAALAAWHGVEPKDDSARAIIDKMIWYAPVAGRTEAELPDEVKAQLAAIDALIAAQPDH